ncbi:MAG: ester cyclase [Chloroflexota bacterium]|nr:ester cyclase [Chloroflexota bacterium]
MGSEQNKTIVRRFFDAFAANDQEGLKEVLSPDLVAYTHGGPDPQNRAAHLQGISGWNAAFETHFTVEEQVAEGDSVATRLNARFVHNRGEWMGVAPTGKEAVSMGISIEHVKDGKIVERYVSSDWLGIMQQLGLVPSPQPAPQ